MVAASRNDDHGGDPLRRTQIFVNALLDQSRKFRLPVELILVDWNPPADRPGLHEVLDFSRAGEFGQVRVIQVPAAIHAKLEYADKLRFYQMIAKNVGIRRARGEFVLATNIDILLSDELMAYIAGRTLDPERMYRVDRYDIENTIQTDATLEEQLRFCWEHLVRVNALHYTGLPPKGAHSLVDQLNAEAVKRRADPYFQSVSEGFVRSWVTDGKAPRDRIHTNACGDFTLLSKRKWGELRGYPEFHAFSFHIDSVFCFAAHYGGARQVVLAPPCVAFHIEHSVGSGWTPEGHKALFDRLEKQGIPSLENALLVEMAEAMRESGDPTLFNDESWGLSQIPLDEASFNDAQHPVITPHAAESGDQTALPVQMTSRRPDSELPNLEIHSLRQQNGRLEDLPKEALEAMIADLRRRNEHLSNGRIGSIRRDYDFHKLSADYFRQENRRIQAELDDLKKGSLTYWWRRSSRRWKRSCQKRATKLREFLMGMMKKTKL